MGDIQHNSTEYLSYLMGALGITDAELMSLGVLIIEHKQGGDRTLEVPLASAERYEKLVADKLDPGFWNDMVGAEEIIFIFKFKDGSVRQYLLSVNNKSEIAQLCHEFSGDPMEKTSRLFEYLAGNKFYTDRISKYLLRKGTGLFLEQGV